jgi:hypothetical protein
MIVEFNKLCNNILNRNDFKQTQRVVFREDKEAMELSVFVDEKNCWFIDSMDSKCQTIKNCLKKTKCADGVIWQLSDNNCWCLHIFELKKKVTKSSYKTNWDHIKLQFAGAYRICKMIAAALDIEFEKIIFYTAYQIDEIGSTTPEPDTDTIDYRIPDESVSPTFEWNSEKLRFGNQPNMSGWLQHFTTDEYEHKKIQMQKDTATNQITGSLQIDH